MGCTGAISVYHGEKIVHYLIDASPPLCMVRNYHRMNQDVMAVNNAYHIRGQ